MPDVQKELDTMQGLACQIHEAVAKLKPKAASVKETSLDLNKQHILAVVRGEALTKELETEVSMLRQKEAELAKLKKKEDKQAKELTQKTERLSDLESKCTTVSRM